MLPAYPVELWAHPVVSDVQVRWFPTKKRARLYPGPGYRVMDRADTVPVVRVASQCMHDVHACAIHVCPFPRAWSDASWHRAYLHAEGQSRLAEQQHSRLSMQAGEVGGVGSATEEKPSEGREKAHEAVWCWGWG